MPRGPKGEKRPADVNARAVMIAKIATGEIEDITTEDGKNAAAVALGRMGGNARAEDMSARRRREIRRHGETGSVRMKMTHHQPPPPRPDSTPAPAARRGAIAPVQLRRATKVAQLGDYCQAWTGI